MSQDFATAFYHSPQWLKNRRNYLNATLDTSGNVLEVTYRDGKAVHYVRGDKSMTPVPENLVVPPGVCERCFSMGRLTPAVPVHHKVHLTPDNIGDPKVTLSYDNLQRLCPDCHAQVHSGQVPSRVTFNEDGTMAPVEEDFMAQVVRLTETVDERRNIHRGRHVR